MKLPRFWLKFSINHSARVLFRPIGVMQMWPLSSRRAVRICRRTIAQFLWHAFVAKFFATDAISTNSRSVDRTKTCVTDSLSFMTHSKFPCSMFVFFIILTEIFLEDAMSSFQLLSANPSPGYFSIFAVVNITAYVSFLCLAHLIEDNFAKKKNNSQHVLV